MKPKTYKPVNATPSTPQHCDDCADFEAQAVEAATRDAQSTGNALYAEILGRLQPLFPDENTRDLDWDVLPATIGAVVKSLTAERERVRVLETELAHLRARAERAEAAQLDAIASCDAAVIRAKRAEAHAARVNNANDMLVIERDALAKDKARLDWLLEHGVQTQHFYTDHMSGGCYAQYYKTRDAIDAAMKS